MRKLMYRLIGAVLAFAIIYGVQAVFDLIVIPGRLKSWPVLMSLKSSLKRLMWKTC